MSALLSLGSLIDAINSLQDGQYVSEPLEQYQTAFNRFAIQVSEDEVPDVPPPLTLNLQPLLGMDGGQYLYEAFDDLQNSYNDLVSDQLDTDSISLPLKPIVSLAGGQYIYEALAAAQKTFNALVLNV